MDVTGWGGILEDVMHKLFECWQKCIDRDGDFVEY